MLNESINPLKVDYKTLLALTGFLTQDSAQVEQMFRRRVFNVLIDNKDNHAKNFSFIFFDVLIDNKDNHAKNSSFICLDGRWTLAPAYELTGCTTGYSGEHATSVMGKGNPFFEDLLATAASIRIPRPTARSIIAAMQIIIKQL